MQLRRAPALLLALGLALAACAPPVPRVARGEALTTGNTTYDDFFVAVRQVRSEAMAARADEDATHFALVKALGLEPATKRGLAVDESALRSQRFLEKGVLLHLEIAPEARMLVARGKVDLGPNGEGLLKTMEDTAKNALEMRKRFAAVAARAVELEKRRVDLRGQAPATFREDPQAKRDDIILELDAAAAVLADALEKANVSAGAASRFVVELAQAVETGAAEALTNPKNGKTKKPILAVAPLAAPASAPIAAAPPAASPPPKPAASPAKPAAAPAAAPAKPAAPAKKKPKGGDDFDP